MPKGIPLTDEEQQRRRREICDASVPLFLDNGFHETTMREIANAAGIGKSTLYDYFNSKDEILVSYFENEIQKITERAQEIVKQESSISEKLRRIMQMHLEYLVDNKNFYLKLTIASQTLPLGSQEKIQVRRHAYQDMLRALIEEGIQRGELRPINPLLAARSVFNLLATAVFTSRPTGTPQEMLEDAFDIFFHGIQA